MKKSALIGNNILQSPSPTIHNFLFEKHGIIGRYDLFNIAPSQFTDTVEKLVAQQYSGFNVTCPYKEQIIPLLDDIDDIAKEIQAVNTVLIKDKKLIGYNTDWHGFLKGISHCDINFPQSTALILGAGGAARAILYALQTRGIQKIYLCNRTWEEAESLAQQYHNVTAIPWDAREDFIKRCHLIINSTTVTTPILDLQDISTNTIINDIIYWPTALQKHPGVINGFGMLLWQADLAWHIFFDDLL